MRHESGKYHECRTGLEAKETSAEQMIYRYIKFGG